MPNRPINIGTKGNSLLPTLNQSIREIQIRIDKVVEQIPVQKLLKTTAILNFGTIPANTAVERSVPMISTTQQSTVHVSPQLNIGNPNLMWSSHTGAAGYVTVRLLNPTSTPITPNVIRWNLAAVL